MSIMAITNSKIFKECEIETNGRKMRVLLTEHIISSECVGNLPLNVYYLTKISGDDMFEIKSIEGILASNDFGYSIISAYELEKINSVKITKMPPLFALLSTHKSVFEYYIETLGEIRLFVIADYTRKDISKYLESARKAVAVYYGRNVDEIRLINVIPDNIEDPLDMLAQNIALMGEATHILDMNEYVKEADVLRTVYQRYELNSLQGYRIKEYLQSNNTNEEILSGLNTSHFSPYTPVPNYSRELALHYPPAQPFYGGFGDEVLSSR